jgi:hypothetical protein
MLRDLPDNLGAPSHLKQVAAGKVGEEQGRTRIKYHVAKRVEVAIAAKVRDRERVVVNADEPGFAAAMGDVDAFNTTRGGDKQRVGRGDCIVRCRVQPVHRFLRLCNGAARLDVANVNVLRAIPETLFHRNENAAFRIGDRAVCPATPARGEINAQQPDRSSGFQPRGCWIIAVWQGGDAEGLRIRARSEPGGPARIVATGQPSSSIVAATMKGSAVKN